MSSIGILRGAIFKGKYVDAKDQISVVYQGVPKAVFFYLEKIIEGCTDSSAMNYLSNATSNNGSCIYAYDIAQGIWNITPDCDDLPIPIPGLPSLNDIYPESIDVQGQGNNTLFIDIGVSQLTGEIDNNGVIIVSEQIINVDIGTGPMDVNVSGNGNIESENSGYMNLDYLLLGLPVSCYFTLSR